MKQCSKCKTEKPLGEFVKDKRRSDGRGSWCLVCNRAYMRDLLQTPAMQASRKAHYASNKEAIQERNRARWALNSERYQEGAKQWRGDHRDELLADYSRRGLEHRAFLDGLKAGPCTDCGETYPPYCMEFDHVRGIKRFALGKMANHRREAVLDELSKCELVCCACHRVRTQARKGDSKIPKLLAFREWLHALKNRPCADCTRIRPAVAMDFDHIGENKVTQVSDMWSWSREKVVAEIAKCELICCICHRIRTQSRKSESRRAAA